MTGPITAPAIHALFCRSGSGLGVASITSSLLVDTPVGDDADTTRVVVDTNSVGVTLRAAVGVADIRVLNDVVASNSR